MGRLAAVLAVALAGCGYRPLLLNVRDEPGRVACVEAAGNARAACKASYDTCTRNWDKALLACPGVYVVER